MRTGIAEDTDIRGVDIIEFRRIDVYALPPMSKTLHQLALKSGDHVGMVGYFPPLVEQVRTADTRLTVLELDERRMQETDEFVVTLDPECLRRCNKVVCTRTGYPGIETLLSKAGSRREP